MKKIVGIGFTVSALSLGLVGCGFWANDTTERVNYVSNPRVVVPVVTKRAVLVGQMATPEDIVVFRRTGVIYRDGYNYSIVGGRYVVVR